MKTVCFIRHAKASSAYKSYNDYPFEEFCKLAKQISDPDLDLGTERLILEKFKNEKFETIFHGPSKRARRTAEIINIAEGNGVQLFVNANLMEIYFEPEKLTTGKEFKERGLESIRLELFKRSVGKKDGAESIDSFFERVKNLEKIILESKSESILCITHSFFMRVLILYFLEQIRDKRNITAQKLYKTHDYNYLDGFTVII